MIYKYSIKHNQSVHSVLFHLLTNLFRNVSYPFARPVQTDMQFVFVVGCGHSGTTLMAAKLGNAPKCMAIGRETKRFLPETGIGSSVTAVEEWIYFAELLGRCVIIEKTPKHIHVMKRISKIIPGAKFIVMVRNPLDNCASMTSRFGSVRYAIERWILDNSCILPVLSDTANYKIVKYEKLTASPERTLRDVCDFARIPWDPAILTAGETIYDTTNQDPNMTIRRSQVSSRITPNNGNWQRTLGKSDEELVITKTMKLAKQLGYTREEIYGYLQ
ncbi:MAG: sulfotransferase family protein [Spirochaetota bacterium]